MHVTCGREDESELRAAFNAAHDSCFEDFSDAPRKCDRLYI